MNLNITPIGRAYRYDFTYRGVRLRKSGFSTHDEAERHALQAMLGVSSGEAPVVTERHPLHEVLTLANVHRWNSQKDGERTYTRAEEFVNFLGPAADLPVAATGPNLLRFREYLLFEKDLGHATCNRYLAAVKGMFDVAREHGWLEDVPSVRKLQETPVERKVVGRFVRGCIHRDWQLREPGAAVAQFLLDTGLRLSEVRRARIVGGRSVFIGDTKNGDHREVPTEWVQVPDYSEAVLRTYLRRFDLTPHDLRHTFITDLIESGTPLPVVMKLAGHRDIGTTQRYYHLTDRGAREAMKRKEEYLKE